MADKSFVEIPYGKFTIFDRHSKTVLAAPHGSYDINTGSILNKVCFKSEFSCVIAKGFTPKKTRINVNRPTEGVGIHSSKEPKTARAKESYQGYKNVVSRVTDGDPHFYIEIHGSRISGIEVALSKLSSNEAKSPKKILTEEWAKLSTDAIEIKVQGIDNIKMTGNSVKKYGIVAELESVFIQFEFSRKLRNQQSLLSKFLLSSTDRIVKEFM